MPWYVVAAFIGYGLLLSWQATLAFEAGPAGLAAVPHLGAKIVVMAIAASYWDPSVCSWSAANLSYIVVLVAFIATMHEVGWYLKPVLFQPRHAARIDNLAVAVTLCATVIFPAVMLVLAGRVVIAKQCASAL